MTFAPSALASCSEATPTPDDTPLISTHSPACEAALQHQHVVRHQEGQRDAGGFFPRQAGGMAIASASSISAYSENAPAQRPMTRSPGLKRGDLGADGDDLAGAFAADRLPAAGLAVQAVAQRRTRRG